MSVDEIRIFNEQLERISIGIGRHLETLQGQIGDRFDFIERTYNEKLTQIDRMLSKIPNQD